MMLPKQLQGRAMSHEDEIWNDPDQPKQQYMATLVDIADGSNLGEEIFDSATPLDGIGQAYQWAKGICQKVGKAGRLSVTGGDIYGSHSEVIEP
jgi:hypothetical protein